MSILNFLLKLNHSEPEEREAIKFLFIYSLFSGLANAVFFIVSLVLFLSESSIEKLPYIYVGSALIATLVLYIYALLERTLLWMHIHLGTLILWGLSVILFWLSYNDAKGSNYSYSLYLWYGVISTLSNMQFSQLSSTLLTPLQRQRLDTRVDVGYLVGSLLGFSVVLLCYRERALQHLFLISGFSFLPLIYLSVRSLKRFPKALTRLRAWRAEKSSAADRPATGWIKFITDEHYRFLLLLSVCSTFALYVVDFSFMETIHAKWFGSDQLTMFVCLFFGLIHLLNLIVRATATTIVNRYGLKFGLACVPVVITGMTFLLTFVEIMGYAKLFVWLIIITKLCDRVLRLSFERTATHILYNTIPSERQTIVQQILEGRVRTLAIGLCGAMLAYLANLDDFRSIYLIYMLVGIVVLWLGAAYFSFTQYKMLLLNALQRRTLQDTSVSFDDQSSQAVLKGKIKSTYPGEALYAIELLDSMNSMSLNTFLIELINHPDICVRLNVLDRIERRKLTDALDPIRLRIVDELDDTVKGALVRVLAVLGGTDDQNQMARYLETRNIAMRSGAMIGLMRSEHDAYRDQITRKLQELASSKETTSRLLAARVIGHVNNLTLQACLLTLLRDEDIAVRQEALRAAERLKFKELWPAIVDCLAILQVRTMAVSALIAGGTAALTEMEARFLDPQQPTIVKLCILRIYGQIQSINVIALLKARLNQANDTLRSQAILSLSMQDYQADPQEEREILDKIQAELELIRWICAAFQDLTGSQFLFLVKGALRQSYEKARERIFLLLSFIHDAQSILRARDNLRHNDEKQRRYAIDLLESILHEQFKKELLAVLLQADLEQILENYPHSPADRLSMPERLREVAQRGLAWNKQWYVMSVLYAVGKMNIAALKDLALDNLDSAMNPIRELAVWTLHHIEPAEFSQRSHKFKQDSDPKIVQLTRQLEDGSLPENALLTRLDRALLLKSTPIFAGVSEDVLVEVASFLSEASFKKDEMILKSGELEETLYIISEGRVRVYEGDLQIADWERGGVIGEFAALDGLPRSASVKALEDTRLFCLNELAMKELTVAYPEIARGIIESLCKRIRNTLTLAEKRGYSKPIVQQHLKQTADNAPVNQAVFLPIEKIFILRTVTIFSETPTYILEEIASLLKEVRLKPGKTIIEKGEIGNCLYIVADGRLSVHDDQKIVATAGPRDVIGEFSLLDAAPRSFTVTALERARLFQLDQQPFYELIADRTEVSRAIIRVLLRYIRVLIKLTSAPMSNGQ